MTNQGLTLPPKYLACRLSSPSAKALAAITPPQIQTQTTIQIPAMPAPQLLRKARVCYQESQASGGCIR